MIFTNYPIFFMKSSIKKAFTFIEMLWVLCIVVILISISTIAFRHGQGKARDMIRKNDLQMIADALISYANDHGHFPSSIYDENIPWNYIITIADAWRKVTESGASFKFSWDKLVYIPWIEAYEALGYTIDDLNSDNFNEIEIENNCLGCEITTSYQYVWDPNSQEFWNINDLTSIIEGDFPDLTNITGSYLREGIFAIVTQWMCISELKNYLVDNWYLSFIPNDPSWEELNLETNYCIRKDAKMDGWTNANDENISIRKEQCYAGGTTGCAKLCKEWYAYVSDWNHFALIAHMESKNNWNYITTACGSCGVECKTTTSEKSGWTDTEQLPCDIIDEFTNTFDCIKNTGVVEYTTWQYYFYIY